MSVKAFLPASDQLSPDVLLLIVGIVVNGGICTTDGIMVRFGKSTLAFAGWPGLAAYSRRRQVDLGLAGVEVKT
jgi:hypothetical protein